MVYQRLTNRVGVFTGGVNIGVIEGDEDRIALVDTGANEGNARKALRCVQEELGGEITTILSTHGHADHFGGHAFVARRTGATVYAPTFDASIIRHPELQPIFLFGGAAPPDVLRQRFILAPACTVDHEIDAGSLTINGLDIEVVALKGHSPNQVGYLVDGVFFCADVVFPTAAIEKYRIPYLFDLGEHLDAMNDAAEVAADAYVPGHGPVESDLGELVGQNRAIVNETLDCIRRSMTEPLSLEQIAEIVFERMDAPMSGHLSFYLLRPTIGAYLTYLEQQGEVQHVIDGKVAKWRKSERS